MPILCQECRKSFSKVSNLRSHVNKKHPGKLDQCAPKKTYQLIALCNYCKNTFVNKSNLKRHIKRQHSENLVGVDASSVDTKQLKLKCNMCQYSDNSREKLILHFEESHDIQTKSVDMEFASYNDFLQWKCKFEKETSASFVNLHGSYKTQSYTKIKYACHRSGEIRRKGTNLRHLKCHGSYKIDAFCPATISVIMKNNGQCKVEIIKTHVGHKQDIGRLFLTAVERQELASKIALKVPFQTILDNVRDSVSNSKLERLHLLKKKDLYNIEKAYNLNSESVRHANDAVSVDCWVSEMETNVLFYKPQNSFNEKHPALKEEDFALIIMTPGQAEMLSNFGDDCICLDGTHGLNGYGFEMNSLLVVDDLREGYPCAFLISNRSDEVVLSIFFSYIKEKIGKKIKPKIFMTDMAESFYNAWIQVMDAPQFRLFCSWHVDKAWRKNLDKVTQKDKRAEVYKMLRILLQEREETTFLQTLQKFLIFCKASPETIEFGNYFDSYYTKNIQSWAYCYRLHCGLNTNMHLERMHRTIKHIYLNGKFVKRLDKGINAVMKFVRDKLFERLIILHSGKLTSKLRDLRQRHKTSLSLNLDLVIEANMGWQVASQSSGEIYLIEEIKGSCSCELVCNECNACLHRYSCTCLDSSVKWNMCKHIHLICTWQKIHAASITSTITTLESDNASNVASDDNLIIDVDVREVESSKLVECISKSVELEESAQKLQEEITKIKAEFLEALATVSSFFELEIIKKNVTPIQPSLRAFRQQKQAASDFAKSCSKTPSNKKILPQRQLFSTRKLSKKVKLKLAKPLNPDLLAIQLLNIK